MNTADTSLPYHTHVCLVSQQPTPNLTPVLDAAFRPQRVVMVVSPDMSERAGWLAAVLRQRAQVPTETIEVPDAWDMHGLIDLLVSWLDRQHGSGVALNVTGGTKPMAMAAQQVFMMAGRPVFYVHQARDQVLWLEPRRPPLALRNRMSLEDFLYAHGWNAAERPLRRAPAEVLCSLTATLALNAASYAGPLGTLNWLAHDCLQRQTLSTELSKPQSADFGLISLIEKFQAAGACTLERSTLRFADEDARFYCNGGWLEQHVADVVSRLAAHTKMQDWAAGLKVRSLDNRLRGDAGGNELDVAFLARNRLHLVECKTRAFVAEGSAAEAVYKLDALTALGGLNTRTMLVSYRPLREGDRQRAADLGIRTVAGSQLSNLEQALRKWIAEAA